MRLLIHSIDVIGSNGPSVCSACNSMSQCIVVYIVISVFFVCSTGGRSGCVLLATTSIQKAQGTSNVKKCHTQIVCINNMYRSLQNHPYIEDTSLQHSTACKLCIIIIRKYVYYMKSYNINLPVTNSYLSSTITFTVLIVPMLESVKSPDKISIEN